MTSLKVGLLGAGYILQAHAKALGAVEGVVLHAVCDLSHERAAQAAARASASPNVYTSLPQLLESDCDVVHVLLPPFLHEDSARQLLDGRQERVPREADGAEHCRRARRWWTWQRRASLHLGVNHNFLFLPGYEALRGEAADGTLGALDHVTVNWLYALGLIQFGPHDNWIVGSEGNVLFELGSHLAAFATDLLGPARRGRAPSRRTRSSFRGGSASFATGTRSAGAGPPR